MLGTDRTTRFAIVGFGIVALLVLSGLTWATVTSLRLDRATRQAQAAMRRNQAQKDLRNRLEIARLRMDREIWPVIIREASRPYQQYGAYYYDDDGSGALKESPLRTQETESWIALYFQVSEAPWTPCWTSPQLSPRSRRVYEHTASHSTARDEAYEFRRDHITCVEVDDSDPLAVERNNLLEQMALAYTPEDLADRIAAVWDTSTNGPAAGVAEGRVFEVDKEDWRRRRSLAARLQRDFLPPLLECEPLHQVRKVTRPDLLASTEDAEREYFPVCVNEMTAIALPLPGHSLPKLALVRRVDIGPDRVFQGFVADLAELTTVLALGVRNLFDQVKLEPVLGLLDADERTTVLGSLPVRLVVPEPEIAGDVQNTTFVRTTVGFAWATAVIALAAIGLGVKRLVSLTERRKEFTYAVTHELRTPLTTFQLYTDMLAAGLVPDDKRMFYLETLNQESQRLSDLITEVLEFARIENDAVHAQMRDHSVRELMDTVRERYASRCSTAGLTLSIEVNGSGDRSLYTDPHIALQILGTLIDNACKYAPAPNRSAESGGADRDSAPPTVQLRVIDVGSRLAIEVADNGLGISPKDRRDLFKPFQRGSQNVVSGAGGIGLGLALAKRWTRLVRGSLELVDRPERRGACFRLTLPISP